MSKYINFINNIKTEINKKTNKKNRNKLKYIKIKICESVLIDLTDIMNNSSFIERINDSDCKELYLDTASKCSDYFFFEPEHTAAKKISVDIYFNFKNDASFSDNIDVFKDNFDDAAKAVHNISSFIEGLVDKKDLFVINDRDETYYIINISKITNVSFDKYDKDILLFYFDDKRMFSYDCSWFGRDKFIEKLKKAFADFGNGGALLELLL